MDITGPSSIAEQVIGLFRYPVLSSWEDLLNSHEFCLGHLVRDLEENWYLSCLCQCPSWTFGKANRNAWKTSPCSGTHLWVLLL